MHGHGARRREFMTAFGCAVLWPFASSAHQTAVPIIGFVNSASPGGYPPLSAFLKGLDEVGFVEGRNVVIEYRWAHGKYERLPALVDDLVQRKVSVIAATSTPAALAARAANLTTPTIFTTSSDPVQLGLVSNIKKPTGNITGTRQFDAEAALKRLELIRELFPTATDVGLLINPSNPLASPVSHEIHETAVALGLKLRVLRASDTLDLATAFKSLTQMKVALVIASDPFFSSRGVELGQLTLSNRIPAIYQYPQFTAAGGLMSFGPDVAESYRLAGVYVGRILKGEKPSDLPIQEVTKVELILNLKTARAFGVSLPNSILERADRVIE
jgi:putative tryptophan/tyrosine transport system substrate-binding protein